MLRKVLWISAALAAVLAAMAASRLLDLGGEDRAAPAPPEASDRARETPRPQADPPPSLVIETPPAPEPSPEPVAPEPPQPEPAAPDPPT